MSSSAAWRPERRSETEARRDLVKYSVLLQRAGLVTATDGNLSVRLDDRRILITPSGLRKEDMTVEAPVIIGYDGEVIEGEGRASSEKKIHLAAYRKRPDVHAVIHAHPVHCIALTLAGQRLDTCLMPETVVSLGAVPVAPYATPSTDELPASIEPFVPQSDAIILERHGSLTMGRDLGAAFRLLEKLEQAAQVYYMALLLGGAVSFPHDELERLRGLREFYGVKTQQVACSRARYGTCAQPASETTNRDGMAEGAAQPPGGVDCPPADAEIEAIVAAVVERVLRSLGESR